MQEITAKLNYLRTAPRKARVVADLVKGKNVKEAISQLSFVAKKSASPIAKLLKSAINNAKNNFKVNDDGELFIKSISVNGGPVLKRYMPRSRGMANQILKRTSHITIILEEKINSKTQKVAAKVKSKKVNTK